MNRIYLTFLLCVISFIEVSANTTDSLQVCFNKIQATDATVEALQCANTALQSEVNALNANISLQSDEIDSLKLVLNETNKSVNALADALNLNITSTRQKIQSNSDSLTQTIAEKTHTGLWIFIGIAAVIAAITFIFCRLLAKRGREVALLSAKADKLNEEIVNRLSAEISEMQSLSKQIGTISTATGGGIDTEQKLITTLADRITFMEMTLYKMDSSVRGHKQLSKSIKQMKDNLLANGYELVDMLGKDYHDGMKVIANTVDDETLPEGKQIITGIIKPQINYQGKMIQSAQITVSQNIKSPYINGTVKNEIRN